MYEKAVEAKRRWPIRVLSGCRLGYRGGTSNIRNLLLLMSRESAQRSSWMAFKWFSGGYVSNEVTRDGEILESATASIGVRDINQVNQGLLNELEIGETGTIAYKPSNIWLGNLNNNVQHIKDENGDLANGIPIAEVTKIDEKLKRSDDKEVHFSTSWQSTGTNELVIDSTPLNGADFSQKLNALISTKDNLGPFSWSSIRLRPTSETQEDHEISREIYLQLKDTDDIENVGIWSHRRRLQSRASETIPMSSDQRILGVS